MVLGKWRVRDINCGHRDPQKGTSMPEWRHLTYHSVNSSSNSVNGDIAIQWEWSNFDPSQNQNPLTDYDKTLHNWLRPRDEHVTQNLWQSTLRERLGKYVKYKALSFFILIYFFSGIRLLTWSVDGFSRTVAQITRNQARKFLLGSTQWPKTFRESNSPKTVKIGR